MAVWRIYCKCQLWKIGTAKIDTYKIFGELFDELSTGAAKCKFCGKDIKYVGAKGAMPYWIADLVDCIVRWKLKYREKFRRKKVI